MGREKLQYTASGENVVIHYQDDPSDTTYGNHAAWFDGGSTAINLKAGYQNQSQFPDWLQEKLSEKLVDASLGEIESLLAYLADNSLLLCGCGRAFPKDNKVSTGFAGVKCGKCAEEDAYCPETDDNTHEMTCVSGRNNARKPTVSKCTECGYKNKTPPTG